MQRVSIFQVLTNLITCALGTVRDNVSLLFLPRVSSPLPRTPRCLCSLCLELGGQRGSARMGPTVTRAAPPWWAALPVLSVIALFDSSPAHPRRPRAVSYSVSALPDQNKAAKEVGWRYWKKLLFVSETAAVALPAQHHHPAVSLQLSLSLSCCWPPAVVSGTPRH